MENRISYIHLTDLHIGQKGSNAIFSQTKEIIKEDISYICDQLGSLDIVFMTGDMVQRGSQDEYKQFSDFINELWEVFKNKGFNPYFICVPGNHDMERESNTNIPVHQAMVNWIDNKRIDRDYFWSKDSEYIKYIQERFLNFSNWYKELNIKKPSDYIEGILPGDFYAVLNINAVKFGIVGLNSTFLQLESGDFYKKIGIYNKQIEGLFANNFTETIKQNDISILLTHHAPDWYEINSKEDYDNEIYIHNSFCEHLCGHMHISSSCNYSNNFANTKNQLIGASLFGLDFIDNQKIERIHGYNAGIYYVDKKRISKMIYPRVSERKSNGFDIDKDPKFSYAKGKEYIEYTLQEDLSLHNENAFINYPNILEEKCNNSEQFNATPLKENNAFLYTRTQELNAGVEELKEKRIVWLCAQFGLGEEEFISSLLKKANRELNSCFVLNCEDINSHKELEKQISEQFSVPLNKLIEILDKNYANPVIIFKNIGELFLEKELNMLNKTMISILNFSKNIHFIIHSSYKPQSTFLFIELKPFSVEDTKHYIDYYKENNNFSYFDIEKIHNLSSGYPIYLDNILEQLECVDIADLSNADYELGEGVNMIPSSIKQYIQLLKTSSSKNENRCYMLLLLLSLLPKGESFRSIKRFNNTMPFNPSDPKTLKDKNLVNVEYYYIIKSDGTIDSTKILRVPRIYRDYILSIENQTSLDVYYKDICSLYLGSDWLQYDIKLSSSTRDKSYSFIYHNTEFALKALIHNSIESKNGDFLARLFHISYNFIHKLESWGLYYIAYYIANDIFSIIGTISNMEIPDSVRLLKYQLADLNRMNGLKHEAIIIYKELLDENRLTKDQMQMCRQCLAYAYDSLGEKENAIFYANELHKNENGLKPSIYKTVAEYIRIEWNDNETNQIAKLKRTYKEAKKLKSSTLSSNIAIKIANKEPSESSLKRIETELKTCTDSYTRMRMIVAKYNIITKIKSTNTFTATDISHLYTVYSYAFNQLFIGILDDTHKMLWEYNLENKYYDKLILLFKYSSFVWEMCNKKEREDLYLAQIKENTDFISWIKANKSKPEVLFLLQKESIIV